ncbi:FAD-binding domain-containing protein [Cuniculiplasma sp. SKW4]|uniref:FAD-binding domain-containing protein n=1 Tax=Cuniculiplasma sp. SKW4 TaxID=3400171 RepID=UPI003FD5DB70
MNSLYILNGNARLQSNDALAYASKMGRKVIPIFLDDTKIFPEGSASRWWYSEIGNSMVNDGTGNSNFMVRSSGEYVLLLKKIIEENKIGEILIHEIPRNNFLKAIEIMREHLQKFVNIRVFPSNNLLKTEEMLKMKVNFLNFSSFYEKIKEVKLEGKVDDIYAEQDLPEFADLNGKFDHYNPKWAVKLRKIWKPGINHRRVIEKLREFNCDNKIDGSRVSPYISHGQIDVKGIWKHAEELGEGSERIKRNIAWREFFYIAYLRRQNMDRTECNAKFRDFPWSDSSESFLSWRTGSTGFKIVDAAMRQLWTEGWISNELRMITSDFLTKCLLVKWDFGARWFMDTLVDADESVNYSSWQYIAGVGGFSWPFFRIFNPIKKWHELDPTSEYFEKFVGKSAGNYEELGEKEQEKIYKDMRKRAIETYKSFSNSHPT